MKDRIIEYIADNGGTATSLDIARDVFKIHNIDAAMAEKLVSATLQIPGIVLNDDGCWELQSILPTAPDSHYVICNSLPQRVNSFHEWASLRLYAFRGDELVWKMVLFEDRPGRSLSHEELAEYFHSIKTFIASSPLVCHGFGNQMTVLREAIQLYAGYVMKNPVISLKQLTNRFFPDQVIRDLDTISGLLGVSSYKDAAPEQIVEMLMEHFAVLKEKCSALGVNTLTGMETFQEPDRYTMDFSDRDFDKGFLSALPELPGVYIMRNKAGNVVYVGKSQNLYNRVNSYFTSVVKMDHKLESIRKNVFNISIELAGSEVEALLLEQEYIEKYQPKYNTQVIVHPRLYKKKIAEQIVFLPRLDNIRQRVLCTCPDYGYAFFELNLSDDNSIVFKKMIDFFKQEHVTLKKNFAIIASWLSVNRHLNCIQVKNIVSLDDVARLVQDYLKSMNNEQDSIIHI